MLIGIDGNEANVKERVGVNIWAFEILKSLAKIAKNSQNREDSRFTIYLSKSLLSDLPLETNNWQYRVIRPAKFWTRWRLPLYLYFHKPRPDVFLSLSHYAPKWSPMPRVICIMDLSFLEFPKAFKPTVLWQLKNWTKESIQKSAAIIAISEFTKQEIIKHYCYPANRITVVYPGVSEIFRNFYKGQSSASGGLSLKYKEKYGVHGRYLLFVGTLQPKKNLPRLLEAFRLVEKDYPDLELVIAGKTWKQFEQIKGGLEVKNCRFIGYVPDQDLPQLLAQAECLVFPSLYEGFGIPAIEAMNVGTPVIVSNTTSLPEIVGDAGIFFNPLNIPEIAHGIKKVLSMPEKDRQKMIKKGMIRAKQFDWDRSADQVLNLIVKLLHC